MSSEKVDAFKCQCGKLLEIRNDSREYFTIYGNLLIGETGGLMGGNLPELSRDIHPMRICTSCLIRMLERATLDPKVTVRNIMRGTSDKTGDEGQAGQEGTAGQAGYDGQQGFAGFPGD